MTPKERVLTALDHNEPDRVPRLSSFTPEFANRLRKYFKMDSDLFNPHGGTEHDLEMTYSLPDRDGPIHIIKVLKKDIQMNGG